VIRTPLKFHRPRSVAEAATLLAEADGSATVLGGGTMLLPMMTRGEASHLHLVDPVDLRLDRISFADEVLKIGSRVTYSQLLDSQLVAEKAPLFTMVANGITGGPQLRNQGTVGGSACFANPSSDLPAVLVALAAGFVLEGPEGRRTVAATDFFLGPFETDRREDELLVEIGIPVCREAAGYYKLKLCEASWPIVTAAALARDDGAHELTLGGVCATPRQAVVGAEEELETAVQAVVTDPWTDVLASGDYRRAVAGPVARRAIEIAVNQRGG
jgi:aerobic carbon-monoxide dehydrogenase medium subunit